MRPIVADILTLIQHIRELKEDPSLYKPDCCCYCGRSGLWHHGHYRRKSDRESPGGALNPIWILRFYCRHCGRTCSVLPECIPPHRWYLWGLQQYVLICILTGQSATQTSRGVIPSRWTISRWWRRLNEMFETHASLLRAKLTVLGYAADVLQFWRLCLSLMDLSKAMYWVNAAGCFIP